jgi:hypothetical protein
MIKHVPDRKNPRKFIESERINKGMMILFSVFFGVREC